MTTLSCHVLLEQSSQRQNSGDDAADGVRLFSKCRNELLRMPAFLDHYRKLGVRRFFLVDNDSTDGTREYLLAQPDVRLYVTKGAFREARGGTDWLNSLLHLHGTGHWCLTVDIDELFRYPGSETVKLDRLTAYLEASGKQAMACLLLDMYPAEPLARVHYAQGGDLVAAAPYFDRGPYKRIDAFECPWYAIYGGVRERIFYPESWDEKLLRRLHVKLYHRLLLSIPVLRHNPLLLKYSPDFPPCLTKIPLVHWQADTQYLNVNHFVSDRVVAAETGVLMHFKLLQDFHQRVVQEMQRGQYYDGASEFVRYARNLRAQPELAFTGECSERFQDNQQLQQLGLMSDTPAWASARAQGKV